MQDSNALVASNGTYILFQTVTVLKIVRMYKLVRDSLNIRAIMEHSSR